MIFKAEFKITCEVLEHTNLKELYKAVITLGIDTIRQYGTISHYDIVRIYDERENEICSIHFGQMMHDLGTDYATIRIRTYRGKNNKQNRHFYAIRKYCLYE